MSPKTRLAAIVLAITGFLGASAPAVVSAAAASAGTTQHAVVAHDTWT